MNKGFNMFLSKFLKRVIFVFVYLFIITGFGINGARSEDNFSCYYSNKDNDVLEKIDTIKKYVKFGANFIPGIGSLVNYVDFYVGIVINVVSNITDTQSVVSLVTDLAGYILGSPEANIVFQSAFNSNQYCNFPF